MLTLACESVVSKVTVAPEATFRFVSPLIMLNAAEKMMLLVYMILALVFTDVSLFVNSGYM